MTDRPQPDVLGLGASLPAPGWTVLDAAREQRFTGELRARTDQGLEYRVYVDRGDVYCAERSTDPTLGTRLVEAGAINTAQLEYGMLRIGEIEHLGRLFDRVPSINRDAVFVLNQLMTEETMRAMAARSVTDVEATPYRHHPSGMHRWTTIDLARSPAPWGELPELALPAPPPDARPVSGHEPSADATAAPGTVEPTAAPPPSSSSPADAPPQETPEIDHDVADDPFDDDVVQWNEPSVLVGTTASTSTTSHERRELFPSGPPLASGDWVDDLGPDGVADAAVAPATHAKLPPVAVPPVEQFEVIWPSGEVDDVTTSGTGDDRADDATATVDQPAPSDASTADTGGTDIADSDTDTADTQEQADTADTDRTDETADADAPSSDDAPAEPDTAEDQPNGSSDDALAVRRAVATIDTGSLAVRRRLASPGDDVPAPPGRLIVGRDHHTAWRNGNDRPTGSVFDAQPPPPTLPEPEPSPAPDEHERRAGALRRLISSLRKTDD